MEKGQKRWTKERRDGGRKEGKIKGTKEPKNKGTKERRQERNKGGRKGGNRREETPTTLRIIMCIIHSRSVSDIGG